MSFIWSIATAFILSYLTHSGWMFIFGLFLGPILYRTFNNIAPIRSNQANPTLFLTIAFEVLGHLSKSKGKVTQDDIKIASDLMDQQQLQGDMRKLAQESFNRGKASNYPLNERLNELYEQYRHRKDVLNAFCVQLIQMAISDGTLHPNEEEILYAVADAFRISKVKMALNIQMMMASYNFHQNQRNTYSSHTYQQGSYQQNNQRNHYTQRSTQSDLNHAYQILGVDLSADNLTIKRAYRKLMNEYHPDKLVSKGLPKEMVESAKKRAQAIQAAYDLIKEHKGFK